jgi:hypothetical protein
MVEENTYGINTQKDKNKNKKIKLEKHSMEISNLRWARMPTHHSFSEWTIL